MVAEYQARRDLITDLLNRVPGFRCIKPEGAFYAFPDIRGTGMDSMDLCEFLLKEAKVGCVPGSVFGARGEGYVRISYASSRETAPGGGRADAAGAQPEAKKITEARSDTEETREDGDYRTIGRAFRVLRWS